MAAAGAWRLLAPAEAEAQGGPGGGGGGGGGGRGRPVAVDLVTPQQRTFAERIEALGQAKARQSVTITSNTTELITRVLFTSGQRVSRGQTLVELKADEQSADVVRAQATVNQARREYERFRELGERGFAPRARVEELQAAYREAQATLNAVQARRQDRVIRAPFSGVIGLSDAAPGQLVNPGAAIATLDDLSSIYVDFNVPERYLGVLRTGLPIEAKADAYGDEPFRGVIARIDTRVDPVTRAVTARAEFANPGGRMKPGMLLRVGVEQETRQGLAVPEAAVLFEEDASFVYVAAPGGGGGERGDRGQAAGAPPRGPGGQGGPGLRAERRQIQVGGRRDGFVEVLEGLRPGERLVAEGLNRINPGQPLRVAGAGGGPPAGDRPGPAAGAASRRAAP